MEKQNIKKLGICKNMGENIPGGNFQGGFAREEFDW